MTLSFVVIVHQMLTVLLVRLAFSILDASDMAILTHAVYE